MVVSRACEASNPIPHVVGARLAFPLDEPRQWEEGSSRCDAGLEPRRSRQRAGTFLAPPASQRKPPLRPAPSCEVMSADVGSD